MSKSLHAVPWNSSSHFQGLRLIHLPRLMMDQNPRQSSHWVWLLLQEVHFLFGDPLQGIEVPLHQSWFQTASLGHGNQQPVPVITQKYIGLTVKLSAINFVPLHTFRNAIISGNPEGLTLGNPWAFAPRHLQIPTTQGQYSSTQSYHCPSPGSITWKDCQIVTWFPAYFLIKV